MRFVCDRCQTKYSIADEKVRQKILKIRCKTCENVITVRESMTAADSAALARPAPPPPPPRAAAPRAVEWYLSINGVQEGPFGLAGLVTRIQAADRADELHVWNDHLDSWKPPTSVPEVAAELRLRSGATS